MEFLLANAKLGFAAAIAVANLILALVVYKNNSKSSVNVFFGLLGLVAAVWVMAMYAAPNPDFAPNNLFWMRFTVFLAAPLSLLFFLLARSLPSGSLDLSWEYLYPILFATAVVMSLAFTPYIFSEIIFSGGFPSPVPTYGMIAFGLLTSGLSLDAIYYLWKKTREAKGLKRQRLKTVLAGLFSVLGLITLTIMLPVLIFKNDQFVPLATFYIFLFLAATAYAIVRHSLFDLRALVVRAVSFLAFIALVAIGYALALFLVAQSLFEVSVSWPVAIGAILVTVIGVLAFQPFQTSLERLTNKIFFSGRYDFDSLLSELSRTMTETIDLDALTSRILKTLTREMHVGKAAFYLADNHKISDVKGMDFFDYKFSNSGLDVFFHQPEALKKKYILFENLEEGPLKELFRKMDIRLAIPLAVEDREVAILVLGEKLSGEIYFPRDLNLLEIFASEAGVAIQNARAFSELKFASESKSRFISVVSHQLRTPISSIKWNAELLEKTKPKPEEKEKYLINIRSASSFLSDQLDSILTALDIYDKNIFLKRDNISLGDLLRRVLADFDNFIHEKSLVVDAQIAPEANKVWGDAEKIAKAMRTLIKNAIHYSRDGQKITIRAGLEGERGERRVVFSVLDEGIGITDEERSSVFREFYRGDQARLSLPDGLGLDMFIAKSFIQAHGGRIWFYSAGRDRGAQFNFALPVGDATISEETIMKKRIFIVEDEKSLVETMSEFLKDRGYSVEVAYNGKEALEKLPLVKPDLILLDVIMPEMSGVDFLKNIQKEGSEFVNLPVLVLSNLQGDEQNFQKMNLKIKGYFVKANSTLEELHGKIKAVLGE